MQKVYLYVVSRDFGFAPNPFHGSCTLATCKPKIRGTAAVGDWVIGMAGTKLKAVGRCVFAMRVSQTASFDSYWSNPEFFDKKPIRNGSRKMQVGDNIYHRSGVDGSWEQADSHHSLPDGSPNPHNVSRDTSADRVLISRHFFYFGKNAPLVPPLILSTLGYRNNIGHRTFPAVRCDDLLEWFYRQFQKELNQVLGQPFQFQHSQARYSAASDKVTV